MNRENNLKKLRPRRPKPRPSLRFSPYAWAKLIYFRDRGETEIGGFGLSADNDPLLIVDLLTVKQRCTPVTVAFDDTAVADMFDELVDQGLQPERFGRIWIHSHPGDCPLPSCTDESTFDRVFGRTNWSVMAIVARNDATYARLSFHVGPGGALKIPVLIDYGRPFDKADWEAWEQEYDENVVVEAFHTAVKTSDMQAGLPLDDDLQDFWDWRDFYDGTPGARPV
jgi:hypothetical protein